MTATLSLQDRNNLAWLLNQMGPYAYPDTPDYRRKFQRDLDRIRRRRAAYRDGML